MASLSGSAGGSKQNSNISISLTSGNLASQLESIKNKAKLTSEQIQNIINYWNAYQEEVKKGKFTQEEAIEAMTENLESYGISIDNTSKSFEKQKEKIKEVETQSKESTKEEIKDQEAYANSINRVNELLNEQASLLNKYRLSATNKLTSNDVDKIITQIGMNLNSGREDDKIRHDILDDIAYTGTYSKKTINENAALVYLLERKGLITTEDIEKNRVFEQENTFSGKFKYDSDISRGLKNPNVLPDINDLLATAILNEEEFENYAKSRPDYGDLWDNYDMFRARMWNSGTYRGRINDYEAFDRYNNKATENRNAFMNALGGKDTLREKAIQVKDDIINTIETGIYEKAVEPSKRVKTAKDIGLEYDRLFNEYMPLQNLSSYGKSSQDLRKRIANFYEKQNREALEMAAKKDIAPAFDGMDKFAKNTNIQLKDTSSKFGLLTKTAQKANRDLALTFRDIGNMTRTMASVMYSAIHLVQALDNAMRMSDSMTAIAYRLERYDNTGASRKQLLNKAFSQANDARSGIDSYATLAQRILATNVTNGNAEEAMRIASLITKSMVLGGSTAQEQSSAQLQLSQALASNILGGDELRAIRENAIGFTEMLAKGLTKGYEQGVFSQQEFANVKIGDLKGLGKKQLLTADVVTKAISLMEEEINKDFSTMPELFSQTMNKLMNTFKKRLNEFNQEGKGLSRIVNLFQSLEKWLSSEKGKQALDKLMAVLDSFVGFLEQMAKILGTALNLLSSPLITMLKGYFFVKPFLMGADLLFGKTDINGNSRAGLAGYGGISKMLERWAQGASWYATPFGSQIINGENIAFGGLLSNIGISLFARNSKVSKEASALGYLNSLIRYSSKPVRVSDFEKLINLNTDISPSLVRNTLEKVLKKELDIEEKVEDAHFNSYLREGLLINALFSNKASRAIVSEDKKLEELKSLFENTASTTAGTSVGNAMANAMGAKGGIIGKALGLAAAHPIATAIVAALGTGVIVRNVVDSNADKKDLDSFLRALPDIDNLTGLQDADRDYLRNKAINWYKEHTSGAFIGTNRLWNKEEEKEFNASYLNEAYTRHEKYFAAIAKNTEKTASNTSSTLDITDEFIRNMNDIRTRSFRGELLMNGNGVNNSWNVVVHNESDIKNVAEQIQQAVIAAQEGMLNAPVMV